MELLRWKNLNVWTFQKIYTYFWCFRFQEYKLPKEEIEEIIGKSMDLYKARVTPVLCHGDFHIRNIVYNDDTGKTYVNIFVHISVNVHVSDRTESPLWYNSI